MAEAGEFLGLVARAELRSASGDWAEAAALWGRVTAGNPVKGDYWARLAEARFAAGDYAGAREAYGMVLELGVRAEYRWPGEGELPDLQPGVVAYRIACCLARMGQRDEAVDALAVALDRGFRYVARARDDECWKPWLDDERLRDLLGLIDPGLTRDEGWRADLRLLAREIKRLAYAPFALVGEEEFDRSVGGLDRDIPGLSDAQILVGMMRLVRYLDDGHAGVRPPEGDSDLSRLLPLDFFLFPEGLFVIGAGPGHEDLLGARVERIGRLRTEEAIAALDPVIVRDNEQQVTFMVPAFLRYTAVLAGLGITGELARASLTVRSADGSSRSVTVPAEPGERLRDRYPPGWTALFVITGRQTFSAAQNTATAIGRETSAIFVGEPTGSRPNFIGETIYFELPYSKVRANAADLYWQTSWPTDYRTWIAPDIYTPPTFAAFSQNEDPAMDVILSIREQFPGP